MLYSLLGAALLGSGMLWFLAGPPLLGSGMLVFLAGPSSWGTWLLVSPGLLFGVGHGVVPCWEHLSTSGWVWGQVWGVVWRSYLVVFGLFGPFWVGVSGSDWVVFGPIWSYLSCLGSDLEGRIWVVW